MKRNTIILLVVLLAATCLVLGLYVGRFFRSSTSIVSVEEVVLEESTVDPVPEDNEDTKTTVEILPEEEGEKENKNEVETPKNLGLLDPEAFMKKLCPPSGTGAVRNQPGHIVDLSFRCGDGGQNIEEHLLLVGSPEEAIGFSSMSNDGIKFQYRGQPSPHVLTVKSEEVEKCVMGSGIVRIDDFLLDGEPLGILGSPLTSSYCDPFNPVLDEPSFQVDGVSFEIGGTRFYLDYKLKLVRYDV